MAIEVIQQILAPDNAPSINRVRAEAKISQALLENMFQGLIETAGRGVDVEVTLVEGGRVGDIADESDANRTDLGIALEPCYYVLNASKRGICALLVRDSDRNAVLVCVGHVYDSRIAFERAVVVVRTRGRAVLEAEANERSCRMERLCELVACCEHRSARVIENGSVNGVLLLLGAA